MRHRGPGSWLAVAAGVLSSSVLPFAYAEHSPVTQTLQGEVVDPATYLKEGQHGSEWLDQMAEAADGGQTLALLEQDTQTLYLILSDTPGADPNELLYDHVGQQVTLKGQVYERGGLRGIVVTSIQSADALAESGEASITP